MADLSRFVRASEAGDRACVLAPYSFTCRGADCMAWRWGPRGLEDFSNSGFALSPAGPFEPPAGDGWVQCTGPIPGGERGWFVTYRREVQDRVGFCGLAGHP